MRIIAGEARGRQISAPRGQHTRPTLDRVRENIFNMIQNDVPGSIVLDLFAGSGALSLEALSRGASRAVMVDSDRNACKVQTENTSALGYSGKVKQYQADWRTAVSDLRKEKAVFDLVFLDPPYIYTDMREVFSALVPLVRPDSLLVLEHQAGTGILVPDIFVSVKQRSWGFCAASFYRLLCKEESH